MHVALLRTVCYQLQKWHQYRGSIFFLLELKKKNHILEFYLIFFFLTFFSNILFAPKNKIEKTSGKKNGRGYITFFGPEGSYIFPHDQRSKECYITPPASQHLYNIEALKKLRFKMVKKCLRKVKKTLSDQFYRTHFSKYTVVS